MEVIMCDIYTTTLYDPLFVVNSQPVLSFLLLLLLLFTTLV